MVAGTFATVGYAVLAPVSVATLRPSWTIAEGREHRRCLYAGLHLRLGPMKLSLRFRQSLRQRTLDATLGNNSKPRWAVRRTELVLIDGVYQLITHTFTEGYNATLSVRWVEASTSSPIELDDTYLAITQPIPAAMHS
jgi:hypothetical protein